eukprot:2826035-Prymnesium_polylepis.1
MNDRSTDPLDEAGSESRGGALSYAESCADFDEPSNQSGFADLSEMSARSFAMRATSGRASIEESEMTVAKRKLDKRMARKGTDAYLAASLALRSVPFPSFVGNTPAKYVLPIYSVNEDKFLRQLGLPSSERKQIEGLKLNRSTSISGEVGGPGLTEAQLTAHAVARLAANPPPTIGAMQRRTADKLLRPFPLGLRFSGKNMHPIPFWLSGAQS